MCAQVFDHPQDMLLGDTDWHPQFKITKSFEEGRFLLTIRLADLYGISFQCDRGDLRKLAEAAARALDSHAATVEEVSGSRSSADSHEPHPTTSIRRDSHKDPPQGRSLCD